MSNTDQKECWSIDGEEFNYGSLGNLLNARCDEVRPGHKVWRGTAKRPAMADFVDAYSVIEDIAAQANDFGGEYADGYPEVSPEHKAKLQALLEQWLAECPSPRFYQVTNAVPYVLTDSDFTQEQLAEITAQEEDATTGNPA